jgi:hypothetical protein
LIFVRDVSIILHVSSLNHVINGHIQYDPGFNSDRNPRSNKHIKTHAEVDAIIKFESSLRRKKIKCRIADLIIIRVDSKNNLYDSEPCYHCTEELKRIKLFKIGKIHFSTKDGNIKSFNFNDWINSGQKKLSSGFQYYQLKNRK